MYLDSEKKKEIFEKYGKSNTDTGSPEAQIALFSYRIAHLTEHLKSNHKDHSTERALKMLVVNVVVCSTTSSKSTSTATVPSIAQKELGIRKYFSLHSNKKAIRISEFAFLLPHIDGKPYSRFSRSFVGISAQ